MTLRTSKVITVTFKNFKVIHDHKITIYSSVNYILRALLHLLVKCGNPWFSVALKPLLLCQFEQEIWASRLTDWVRKEAIMTSFCGRRLSRGNLCGSLPGDRSGKLGSLINEISDHERFLEPHRKLRKICDLPYKSLDLECICIQNCSWIIFASGYNLIFQVFL